MLYVHYIKEPRGGTKKPIGELHQFGIVNVYCLQIELARIVHSNPSSRDRARNSVDGEAMDRVQEDRVREQDWLEK